VVTGRGCMLGICYFAWSEDMCAGCFVPLLQPVEETTLLFLCHDLFDQPARDWYTAAAGYRAYMALVAGNDGIPQSLGA
jgi:hypothetical protein